MLMKMAIAIFIIASSIFGIFVNANLSFMPTETVKRKICGARLTKAVMQACTPPGFATPCFHFDESDEFGNQKNVMQKRNFFNDFNNRQSFIELMSRRRRSIISRERRSGGGISDICCKHGCNLKDLQDWCCNDEEFEQYKQLYG